MADLARNATEEFFEEILFGSAYQYGTPAIRDKLNQWFPDEKDEKGHTKPNIMKDAFESAINVLIS